MPASVKEGGHARVRADFSGELGNVVHRVIRNVNGLVAHCKVKGGWTLVGSSDRVTCQTCLRKERR